MRNKFLNSLTSRREKTSDQLEEPGSPLATTRASPSSSLNDVGPQEEPSVGKTVEVNLSGDTVSETASEYAMCKYLFMSNSEIEADYSQVTGWLQSLSASVFCCCLTPKVIRNPVIWLLRIWLFPWLQIAEYIFPKAWKVLRKIQHTLLSLVQQVFNPLRLGRIGCRWILNMCLISTCITLGTSFGVFEYGVFYYLVMPADEQYQPVQFVPHHMLPEFKGETPSSDGSLFAHLHVTPSKAPVNQSAAARGVEASPVHLKNENYQISVHFQVAESQHNFQQGNLFLGAHLFSANSEPLANLTRIGSLRYKGQLSLFVKEVFQFIPGGGLLMRMLTAERDPLSMQQEIIIDLVENLDNAKSNLELIELELNNKNLQFSGAHVVFKTVLSPFSLFFGFRWFMREYFWVVAMLTISNLSIMNSLVLLLFVFGWCCPSKKKKVA